MKILSVNAGSSSLKFQVYEMPEETVLMSGVFERIGIDGSNYTIKCNGEKIKKDAVLTTHKDAVKILTEELINYEIVKDLIEIKGVGHRVVHGGSLYSSSVIIDDTVLNAIDELSALAPLHNPANVIGIKAFKDSIPTATAVAVFDTAFHQTMPEENYLYPVPYEWYTKYGVRKYGFHGTSHKYLSIKMQEILNKKDCNVITCHIGNGGSISAIENGKCIDTSMGFTPMAGIMMGSRSGDIDTTILPYVMKETGKSLDEVINDLNKNSGYLGVSQLSSDSRDIEDGVKCGNAQCILAQKMYVRKIIDYIAKYYVELGHVDGICFSAGVGENSVRTRQDVIKGLKALNIELDEEKNNVRGKEALISSVNSSVPVYVVPTDEEVMIAKDTFEFVK